MEVGKNGMNFTTGLPHISKGYDSIWVIMDRLTKVAHFIPVKTTYKGSQLAELYMARIVCLHGYQIRSCLIKVRSLPQDFGEAFMRI